MSARIWAARWPAGSALAIAASVTSQYSTASREAWPNHKDFRNIGLVLHLVLQPVTHVIHQQLDGEVALERPEVEQVELEHEKKFPERLLIKCK